MNARLTDLRQQRLKDWEQVRRGVLRLLQTFE
jgi:hypothetical protein